VRRLLVIGVIAVIAVVAGFAIAIAIAATNSDSTSKAGSTTVSVKKIAGAGSVLVDSKGRALYRSDQEQNGMVLCTGACLSFWQPLTVSGRPTKAKWLSGKLAVVRRPDGGRQVTYNGKLLYSFKLDTSGKVSGDGFKDAFGGQTFRWHVARPLGSSSSGSMSPTPTPSIPGY
jgi:predicted lipoprotein with Yx(FWY)xxD motif